ncbi:urocanate hydratase [Bacillus cereus Rock3-44]|nr:urocanate hydratase [Bacillus cereus Rock3-44]
MEVAAQLQKEHPIDLVSTLEPKGFEFYKEHMKRLEKQHVNTLMVH